MIENKKVLCDHCKKDLSGCEYIQRDRLNLASVSIPMKSQAIADVLVRPTIEKEHNFCGLGCLKRWIESIIPDINPGDIFCPEGKCKEEVVLKDGVDLTCNRP